VLFSLYYSTFSDSEVCLAFALLTHHLLATQRKT